MPPALKRKKSGSKDAALRDAADSRTPRVARVSRRGGQGGSGLTADRIRDEALRLIDAEGLEAFSTRRLGAALGCEAMAIYWYYPSKDALLDAVVEAMIARLPVEPATPGDWIDALRKLAHAYRRLAQLHPHAFPLLATRRFATEGTWRFLEGLFDLAHRAGLDDRSTARFYRAVSAYCSGVALNELAGLREASLERTPELASQAVAAQEAYPRLAAVSVYLETKYYDDVFVFGLEVLLEALERASHAAPTAATPKPRPKRR